MATCTGGGTALAGPQPKVINTAIIKEVNSPSRTFIAPSPFLS
jgi:hypothetical protein